MVEPYEIEVQLVGAFPSMEAADEFVSGLANALPDGVSLEGGGIRLMGAAEVLPDSPLAHALNA